MVGFDAAAGAVVCAALFYGDFAVTHHTDEAMDAGVEAVWVSQG